MPRQKPRKRTRDDDVPCDEQKCKQEQCEEEEGNAQQEAAGDVVGGQNAGENDVATDAKDCGAEDEVVCGGSSEEDGGSGSEGDGGSGSDEESESSSEWDGDSSEHEDPFLGDCEFISLNVEFEYVLTHNEKYTAPFNKDDFKAFHDAGIELLGPFYSVLMAECIGSPTAFLSAIRAAAAKAAVQAAQKNALSQTRRTLLKEAVSLAVYNYACSKTPKKHPLTGQKIYLSHLFATMDFKPGENSFV